MVRSQLARGNATVFAYHPFTCATLKLPLIITTGSIPLEPDVVDRELDAEAEDEEESGRTPGFRTPGSVEIEAILTKVVPFHSTQG